MLGTSVCAALHVRVRLVKRAMRISELLSGSSEQRHLPCQQEVAAGEGGQLNVVVGAGKVKLPGTSPSSPYSSGSNWNTQPPLLLEK